MAWTIWIISGAFSGALAVMIGAFGAHALKTHLPSEAMSTFELASRYHLIHSLALLAVGFLALRIDATLVRLAGTSFLLGTLIFSGSLYALAISGQRWLGMITPFGGVALILGWILLGVAALRLGS